MIITDFSSSALAGGAVAARDQQLLLARCSIKPGRAMRKAADAGLKVVDNSVTRLQLWVPKIKTIHKPTAFINSQGKLPFFPVNHE